MGMGKHRTVNSENLCHKIEVFDFETGAPTYVGDRRQYLIIKGGTSRVYKNAVEQEEALKKRKGQADASFNYDKNAAILALRYSSVVQSALIDVGDEEPDVIEFEDINSMPSAERNKATKRIIDAIESIPPLLQLMIIEVAKDSNFLPGAGQSLSTMLSSESGTAPSLVIASEVV